MTKFVAFLFVLALQTSFVFAEEEGKPASDQTTDQKSALPGEFDGADLEIVDED